MPSIALESPSVVQFFNMFEQKKQPVHAKKSASTNNTPNRSTTNHHHHHRKNSKPSRASSVSPKPNKKLPNTPKTKKQSVCQEQAKPGSQAHTGRYPGGSGSRRNTGEFKNVQKPSNNKINCPKNNNNNNTNQNENQSDSSLSVKSSKPSNINGYVKLAKLTNKSDSDNDSPGNSNASHRSSQRMRYRNEDSSVLKCKPNSEHYAGSAEAPDAKSLPLPPTDWIETKKQRSNRVPKNTFTANSKKNINNSNSKDLKEDLTPNVQHLFASMGMVKASA